MQSDNGKKTAIIPLSCLGDSLIYTIIAQCYSDMGHKVMFYSNTLASMNNWFPSFFISSFENPKRLACELTEFDLILCDPAYKELLSVLIGDKELEKKTIWITATNEITHLQKKLFTYNSLPQNDIKHTLGVLRPKNYKELNSNMVRFTQNYCQTIFKNSNASDRPKINIPHHLNLRKNKNRIAIFPITPNPEKNYCLKHFIKTGEKLRKKKLTPEFVLTNEQANKYKDTIEKNGFKVRSFTDINGLAAYIYESSSVLSNDSGGGHLSSLLGIPTVTIYKKKGIFEWRPGWRESKVIRPILSLKLRRKRIWSCFVNKKQICKYLEIMANS